MSSSAVVKGTRDFLPQVIGRREYLFDTIKTVYRKFGYMPIETPAMEKMSTLTGKYGEEGDRLIFKILNSGDFMSKTDGTTDSKKLISQISEKALRYDLTVPFARFVAANRNEIAFPFKRYQIQPVWRADRPQRGRYREFFQCDADVVGSDSLLHELEFIQIFDEVLSRLGLKDFTIKMNNRKILAGLAEISGQSDKLIDITVALDKLDKIGREGVEKEWRDRGVHEEAIGRISKIFSVADQGKEAKLGVLEEMFAESEIGQLGIAEMKQVFAKVDASGLEKAKLDLDITLARGLDYYTGAIFEVVTNEVKMGSICGGGRYDDLTSMFGLPNMSGVGISFGADRIYDVLEELNLWPEGLTVVPQILFINFGEAEENHCLGLLKQLRANGIDCELYPVSAKMRKQMKYANEKGFTYVALVGSKEMEENIISLKEMKTGEQADTTIGALIEKLRS